MRCVTSFGEEGYKLYGKRFLETYVEHVGVPIDVYIEGQEPKFQHELVTYKNLLKVPGCADFLTIAGSLPAFRGHAWGEAKRNYRFDVFRFCRKSFAQIDAASRQGDWLYWIDADVEFKGDFKLPKRDAFMLYLGRPSWHSCASFIGFNTKHEVSGAFFKQLWTLYVTGTVFALPEWHDSFINDWLRKEMGLPAYDLAISAELGDGPVNVFDSVFTNAHHKKGNIKFAHSKG